jgi:homoserine O-acetyltransferase
LEINKLFALIGGSVGGGIAWEILAELNLLKTLFLLHRLESDDWLIANCYLQSKSK